MEWLVARELAGCAALLRANCRRPEQPLRTALGGYRNGKTNEHRAASSFMRVAALVRQRRLAPFELLLRATSVSLLFVLHIPITTENTEVAQNDSRAVVIDRDYIRCVWPNR